MFKVVPFHYWKDTTHQRLFLESIAKSLGVKTLDDWANVTVQQVRDRGGSGVLSKHGFSLKRGMIRRDED
jgi:hypothetical protein